VSVDRTDDLSREDLIRLLDATRAMARATVEPRFDDMMAEVLRIALLATRSDHADLYVLEPGDGGELVLVGCHPPPTDETPRRIPLRGSPMEEPLATGRPRAHSAGELDDAAKPRPEGGIRHAAIVPMAIRGKPGASFNIARRLDAPYDASELNFAQLLGELLVVYADNARLYAEAQRRLDETAMMVEVARAVSASPELDKRLDASAEILAKMVDASNAFIMLLEDGGTVLHGVATSSPSLREEFRAVRIPIDAPSIAARVVSTKQPVIVEDATASTEVQRELVSRYGEKSLVALPLMLRDEAIGAVVFDDTRRVRAWSTAEIQRAELIAQTVAVGVANARLYDEVRRRSVQLERAQAELVGRERLAALGQLAAVMAHEVRNPLGVLFNSIGTLGKLIPGEGDSAQLLAIMREEATRLERLVRELLDFAKPLAPSLESEPLDVVLFGAVDAATRELGPAVSQIVVAVADDVPHVCLDASMIRRAVVNLVVNGMHAAGPEGRVDVRASLDARGRRRVARIDVADSGPGIPPEIAPRVFEPFFTTKATGTGLGLAVVKSIVECHGGEIDLRSTPGTGTTVSVFLPVDPDSSRAFAAHKHSAW
jgi:two-component system, NtrC family, sensor histidine kinase HydH